LLPSVAPAGSHNQVDKCPGANNANDQEANWSRHLDGNCEECSQRPGQLKLRFELRKGATLVGTRRIALHNAFKAQTTDCSN